MSLIASRRLKMTLFPAIVAAAAVILNMNPRLSG